MKFQIERYSLQKEFISKGELQITEKNHATYLIYKDSIIEESASALYHPITALESLRKILEDKHKSILACNGCRVDTDQRATGSYNSYLIELGQPATELINMFEPTDKIEKLCTIEQHEIAFQQWIDSVMK